MLKILQNFQNVPQTLQNFHNIANVAVLSECCKCYKYCGGLKMLQVFWEKVTNVAEKMFANAAEPTDVAVLSMLQRLQWP